MHNFITMCVVLLLCCVWVNISNGAKKEKNITVEGVAAIHKSEAIARDQAIDDALRQAVSQAVGTLVHAESIAHNHRLLNEEIYAQTRGYVQEYRIIDERRDGNMLRVTMRAIVNTGALQKKLAAIGILYWRIKKPRFMVVISEADAGRRAGNPAGETEIISQLLDYGFKVVDQSQIRRIRESDQIRKILAGDKKAAKLIALRHGAEMLIVGKAFGETAMRGQSLGGLVSVRARLEARAIRADTGEILVADGKFASGVDIEEQVAVKKALAEVGKRWVESNLPEIMEKWKQETSGVMSVQLVINGLSLPQLVRFETVLKKEIRGVDNLQRRSFDNKVAILDMDLTKGTGQDFADNLAQQRLSGFGVEVIRFSPNFLDLKVWQSK